MVTFTKLANAAGRAGAVVVRSVPPRGVVAGNPARLLATTGAFALVEYPGMEADPERSASLALAEEASHLAALPTGGAA